MTSGLTLTQWLLVAGAVDVVLVIIYATGKARGWWRILVSSTLIAGLVVGYLAALIWVLTYMDSGGYQWTVGISFTVATVALLYLVMSQLGPKYIEELTTESAPPDGRSARGADGPRGV